MVQLFDGPPIEGVFVSPFVAVSRTPSGVLGRGALTPSFDGLLISASKIPAALGVILGTVGSLMTTFGGLFVLSRVFRNTEPASVLLVALVSFSCGALAGTWLARMIGRMRRYAVHLPVRVIRGAELIGHRLSFRCSGALSGWVHFDVGPENLETVRAIAQRLRRP